MTTILVCCAVLIVAVGGLYVLLCHEPFLAACWYRMFPGEDPYVPEAADAPDPVDEHFKSSPRVVAGSDIDRQLAIRWAEADAAFDALVAAQLSDLDTHLSAYYVLPEGNR